MLCIYLLLILDSIMNYEELNEQPKGLFKLSQLLNKGIIDLEDIADIVPGIMHVNSRKDLAIDFISKTGSDIIRYSLEELELLGVEVLKKHQSEYTQKYIYTGLLSELAKDDKNHVISFFQDWQYNENEHPVFHFTTTKILNENQTISISLFPQKIEYLTKRINDIFGINMIFEKYFKFYCLLTKREKQILQLLGKELKRKEISDKLYIAETTVKTHCESIYKKLQVTGRIELAKIASAFSIL